MDMIAEVARGLAALHRRSPMAALATARWMCMFTPLTARGVACAYAALIAAPLRMQVLANGGWCEFVVVDDRGVVPVDSADPRPATIGRMVNFYANGDPDGAEATWSALAATASRWQVVETLHRLAGYAARADG